jgi:hypothetical protein
MSIVPPALVAGHAPGVPAGTEVLHPDFAVHHQHGMPGAILRVIEGEPTPCGPIDAEVTVAERKRWSASSEPAVPINIGTVLVDVSMGCS